MYIFLYQTIYHVNSTCSGNKSYRIQGSRIS